PGLGGVQEAGGVQTHLDQRPLVELGAPAGLDRVAAVERGDPTLPAIDHVRFHRGKETLTPQRANRIADFASPLEPSVLGKVGDLERSDATPRGLSPEDSLCRPKEREARA